MLKLYENNWTPQQQIKAENEVLLKLNDFSYPIPYKNNTGEYISKAKIEGKPKLGRLLSFLEGNFLAESHHTKTLIENFGTSLSKLDKALSQQKSLAIQAKKDVWDLQYNHLSNATKINLHFCLCHFLIYFTEKPRFSPTKPAFFNSSIKKWL